MAEEIKAILRSDHDNFENITNILDIEWPEDVYERTQKIIQEQVNPGTEKRIAILWDTTNPGRDSTLKEVCSQWPGVEGILREIDGVEKLTNTTRITTSRTQEVSEKSMYAIPFEINQDGVNDMEGLYTRLCQFKEQLTEDDLVFLIPRGISKDYVRKLLEYVLRHHTVKIKIVISGEQITTEKGKMKAQKIMIKTDNSNTYADLVKSIKANVDLKKIGVGVTNIKKTQTGNVMLEVVGGKADILKKEIADKVTGNENTDIRIQNREKYFFVSGMDVATTETELTDTIAETTGCKDTENIRVIFMNQNQRGEQTAMIAVSHRTALRLQKIEKIKIGWVTAKIRQKVTPIRCYKCLEFGHRTGDCTG